MRNYRLLSLSLLFSLILLLLAKGKFYYYFPIILGLIPLGAVFFEQLLQNRKWILYSYICFISIFGILLLPSGLPILKLDNYIELYNLEQTNDNRTPITFEHFYSKPMWGKIVQVVKKTYDQLPSSEQNHCLIWGRHYSHAGAMNLLGKKYNLPKAFSFHGSYFAWVPEFSKDITIILIGDVNWTKQNYQQYFDEVEEIDVIENPYALNGNLAAHTIFLDRKLKYNSEELKDLFKDEIF